MTSHPYIPNSVPKIKQEMFKEIGVRNLDELLGAIPKKMRFSQDLELPDSRSEFEVRKRIESILSTNKTCNEILTFLGAGCWPHYVPAVCDEINSRSEFLTAYTGDVYTDLGRYQALFEFQSMIGDLVEMDVVTFPVYDWATASGDAVRMSAVITDRHEILVPKIINPDKLSIMKAYCGNLANIRLIDFNAETGQLSLDDLKNKISSKTAGIYIENPTYLGFIETQGSEIGEIAHNHGALLIVGVDPISLGLLAPPGEYGADIVCGEGQPLGIHMNFGGGLLGFLAYRDDERFISATGHRLITLTSTDRKGEWGFTYVSPGRTMFVSREKAITFTGTATVLWAITAAVYMSLLGPQGIQEIGEVIMQKSHYALKQLSEIIGIEAPIFDSIHFKEFTINFDGTGKTVKDVNKALLKYGIQGGKDVTKEFSVGNTALYCVTEIHTKEDIDKLARALEGIVK